MTDRPAFALVLRPEAGVDPHRAMRAALKRLLRDHGLRCVSVGYVGPAADPAGLTAPAGGDAE